MVGNILMDTLRFNHGRLKKPDISSLGGVLDSQRYLVFTLNRKALIADTDNLSKMLSVMAASAGDMPIIAPLRGSASQVVCDIKVKDSDKFDNLLVINSLSYLEFGWLTAHAAGVITDSGNVAEEATFNGVPCITLNNYTSSVRL